MAELGTIASIVGVVGFIGQVTQGCVYLKGLIGDIKAASQEMRRLQRELDIIVTICDELSTLYTNTNQQGADSTSALELCKEAVIEVSSEISPALLEFNKTKSTGVRLNRYLNQLKAAFSSPRMKQKIEKLSRAKDSLLAAQGNLSLTLINDQANRSLRLQECITRTELDVKQGLAETRKIQEGILALQVDASTSNGLQSEAVGAFRKLDDGIGHLQVQLAGTNLGVPRIEDGMADLRAQFSVSSTTMQQSLDAIPEIMRQIGEGLAQRQEEVLSQFLPDALRTALIRNHQSRGIETQRSVPVQARSDHVSKSSAIASIPRERPRNRRTARIKSTTLFCGISIITSEPLRPLRSIPNADDQEETDYDLPVYSSQTTIRIFAKLGVLNRVFEFTKFNHKYGNNIGATMKTRNIVSNDSEIFRAVKAADLVTMRQLFKNGQASPFDVNTRGDSLLDECVDLITKITCMDKINNQGSIPPDHESRFAAIPKFFEMTKLLLKYGVEFQSYSLACPVNYVLAGMDNSARKLQMLPSGFWSEICFTSSSISFS